MKNTIRFVRPGLLLVIALSAIAIAAPPALAQKPVMWEWLGPASGTLEAGNPCEFAVQADGTMHVSVTDFYDQSGSLTRENIHAVQQDTYTAYGKSLTGVPFQYNIKLLFDSDGNPTHFYQIGVSEKIWLPDGSLFIAAGRFDYIAHDPVPTWVLSPDNGNPGNLAGFCAALR